MKIKEFEDLWNSNNNIGLNDIIPFNSSINEVRRIIQHHLDNNDVKYVVGDIDAYMPIAETVAVIFEEMKRTTDLRKLYFRVQKIMRQYVREITTSNETEATYNELR